MSKLPILPQGYCRVSYEKCKDVSEKAYAITFESDEKSEVIPKSQVIVYHEFNKIDIKEWLYDKLFE